MIHEPERNRPGEAPSIVRMLRTHAVQRPDKTALILLSEGEEESDRLTYGELDRRARSLAVRLQAADLAGEQVLLPMPTCLEYAVGMLGCLYARAVPVPIYPPGHRRHAERINGIVGDCRARLALTTAARTGSLRTRFDQIGITSVDCEIWAVDGPARETGDPPGGDGGPGADGWAEPELTADTLAYLQYTSGSTSDPRGVMISHGNLAHQFGLLAEGFDLGEHDVNVSWLPIFHDLGLVAGLLHPLYLGATAVLMPPVAFVQRPERWLDAIVKYRGTTAWAPNFALELCCDRIDAAHRARLDLSSLRMVTIGAEPVRPDTLERFAETFGPCGFGPRTFTPGYGMAEATLALTNRSPREPLTVSAFGADALSRGLLSPAADGERSRRLVGNGHTWLDTELLVVDPDTGLICPDNTEGELWVRGATVASGYWNQPEETARTFGAHLADGRGPFLRTGDLGALADGEVYVTGRLKDLIIVRGRNLHPQDIELTAARSHPGLAPERGAAFPVDSGGQERLVVVHEVARERRTDTDPQEIVAAVRQAVTEEHDVELGAVVLLRSAALPITSSGKVRRRHCKQLYLNGELAAVHTWEAPTAPVTTTAAPAAGMPVAAAASGSYESITQWLVTRIAERGRLTAEHVGVDTPFSAFGLDSLTLVGISGELGEALGRPVQPTLLYEHPTVARLARALSDGVQAPPVRRSGPPGEPIAVVGMACRFPGAESVDAYWDLILAGRDAITEVPADRWPADAYYRSGPPVPGRTTTRWGGFIDRGYDFDAGFFGISAQEARSMDPQQRLLLTLAWRALEDAGIPAESIADGDTGVFVGISGNDYARLQIRDHAGLDAHSGTGNALSVAANRISYFFDLHGPSVAVDTACSSSLVALHQAVTSLRQGECELAVVAGVNLLLSPDLTVVFSQADMMAPDGRCKVFDARADGYVRGEGCGVVILKRHEDARRAGDRVHAVVHGSAVNQDGRSNSLTAPNGLAQEAVIRQALAAAGMAPGRIGCVEAHGTGTSLGDPVEVAALQRVYGEPGPGTGPVWIGSAKACIGHLEAAAGIAGLIKAVLMLRHRTVPRQPHFQELNPYIALAGSRCRIPERTEEWPTGRQPRAVGVSSFGFGGTNAHVILTEAEEAARPTALSGPDQQAADADRWELLPVSAKGGAALRRLAQDHADLLEAPLGTPFPALCAAAGARRTHHDHRVAVVARSAPEAAVLLRRHARGEEHASVFAGLSDARRSRPVAFLFTGQGSQYPGMAGPLYARHTAFRRALDRCDRFLTGEFGIGLLPTLCGSVGERVDLAQTRYAQPALFAVEYAMAELWHACGVRPDYVLGHSVGEYVAACVAGVLSPEDALLLLNHRGKLMQEYSPTGAMYAVHAPAPLLAELCAELHAAADDTVCVAAVNGAEDITLSGDPTTVTELTRSWADRGARVSRLGVDRAFHSPLMRTVAERFAPHARSVSCRPPTIGLVCDLSGELAGDAFADPGYWTRQLLEPVLFGPGLETLKAQGCQVFLEVGPHPALTAIGAASHPDARWLATLHRDDTDDRRFLSSLAEHYVHGGRVDWTGAARERTGEAGRPPAPVPLPGHPLTETELRYVPEQSTAPGEHPLLGTEVELAAAPGRWFAHTLRADRPGFLAQHRVLGGPVLPAAAMLEWALAAARASSAEPAAAWTLGQVTFNEPLRLAENEPVAVQATADGDGRVRCYARGGRKPGQPWTEHVTVTTAEPAQAQPTAPGDTAADASSDAEHMTALDVDDLYQRFAALGLDYGPDFRALKELRSNGDEALGLVEAELSGEDGYVLHPVVLDACFHAVGAFLPGTAAQDGLWLPAALDRITVYDRLPSRVRCHVRRHGSGAPGDLVVDLALRSDQGTLLADLEGLRLRQVAADRHGDADGVPAVPAVSTAPPPRRYDLVWQPFPDPAGQDGARTRRRTDGTWLVLSPDPAAVRDWPAALGRPAVGVLTASAAGPPAGPGAEHLLDGLSERPGRIDGVVLHYGAAAAPGTDPAQRAYDLARHALPLLQQVLRGLALEGMTVVITSVGACRPVSDTQPPDPAQSVLTGLTAAIAAEYPEVTCVQVDTDPNAPATPAALLERVDAMPGSGHLAQRGDDWYRARVREGELPERPAEPGRSVLRPDGAYLVTGGWGGLGQVTASWLAARGARTLLLVGRTVPVCVPPSVTALRNRGVRVELLAADVAEESGALRIAQALDELPPLRGIVHAAGVSEDAAFSRLDWGAFARVMDAKVRGAWRLHRLAGDRQLDLFVLFSSMAALTGSAGQANYTVANAFLDSLAQYRRHLGLPAVSVAWGPWADAGMAADHGLLPLLARQGVHALRTDTALDALDRLLATAPPQVGVARLDWPLFTARSAGHPPYPSLDRPAPDTTPDRTTDADDAGLSAERLAITVLEDPEAARKAVLAGLLHRVTVLLALDSRQRDELRPSFSRMRLNELGIDSLMAVRLRNRLLSELSTDVPPHFLLGGNTVGDVAELICRQLMLRSLVTDGTEPLTGETEVLTL
ncbi:Long-chain-fatty-acid--CoA ligase, 6-deoxyerythronolide-B synthase [Actinobacteria bacterium OK074]|nr:Long-chain-fatty-acid--CoA ligase, 6-deoxyerythronolide-B synthase [Actinobacteria bacterium OK074]